MYPAETADGVVRVTGDRQVGYLMRGPDDGRAVVHLHGMPGSRLEQHLVFPDEVLARFGLRVVSIDRPGYGNTDPLPGTRPSRVRDVLAVADHLGIDRFVLLAVSAGGSYAVTLAALAPERVERLVLCCAQMPYDDDESIAMLQPAQAAALPFLRQGRSETIEQVCAATRAAFLDDAVAAFTDTTATLSTRERAWYLTPRVRAGFVTDMLEAFRVSAEGYIDDALNMVRSYEVDPVAVACPVRAVHGSDDDWEPLPNLRRVLAQLADAQLYVIDGMNHFGAVMQSNLLAALCLGDE